MQDENRYQLRHAAGMYWLMDMKQTGETYQKPISFNECGAAIYHRYRAGEDEVEISEFLHKEYGIEQKSAAEDVRQFLQELQEQGF